MPEMASHSMSHLGFRAMFKDYLDPQKRVLEKQIPYRTIFHPPQLDPSEAEHALDFERDQARMEVEAANAHGITNYRSAYRDAEKRQAFRISSLETKLAAAEKAASLCKGGFEILVKTLKGMLPENLYQSVKQKFDPEFNQLRERLETQPKLQGSIAKPVPSRSPET